ncbi:MAG: hypothetical protein ACKO1U_03105, partial [Bacteroidota bacterium]
AGPKTYYCDDIQFAAPVQVQVDLPIDFDDSNVNYNLVDFGGNVSSIVTDPVSGTTQVLQVDKTGGAQLWAGTTIGGSGLASQIFFFPGYTTLTMRVWSPDSGIVVRMKAEDPNDPTHSVETDVLTTTSNAWETLSFDFSNQATGTAPIDYSYTYQKLSVFFNFGVDGATAGPKTYYCDDIQFAAPVQVQVDLPIDFDGSNVNYNLVDFGGNVSSIVIDPVTGITQVLQVDKTGGAQLWAGTTIGGNGLANPIPFSPGNTTLSMRVWSPDSGIVVRMKAEDPNDPTHSVETDVLTTTSNAWETLSFDFSNQATGTAPIDYTYTYQKLSVFFNFGVDGATAGPKTYYCDDIQIATVIPVQVDLPVTFDDPAVNYDLIDFGGNGSLIGLDPTGASNLVCSTTKFNTAQLWAGTTIGGSLGFANPIPFAAGATTMSMRVYSPDAGVPIRLKAEDPLNGAISVETEAVTTTSNAWETLVFDFANPVSGTAAINFSNNYQKLSAFFNFGTDGATAGTKTYYWDDVQFGGSIPPVVVTFQVQNPDSLPVYVFGSWSGWSNFPGTLLSATSNPNIYEGAITLNANTPYEYLFVNGGATAVTEVLNAADPCTNGNTQYTNRTLVTGNMDMTVCSQWASCNTCLVTGVINQSLSELYTVVLSDQGLRIIGDASKHIHTLFVHDPLGRLVYSAKNDIEINTLIPFSSASGLLVIRFTTDEGPVVLKAIRPN